MNPDQEKYELFDLPRPLPKGCASLQRINQSCKNGWMEVGVVPGESDSFQVELFDGGGILAFWTSFNTLIDESGGVAVDVERIRKRAGGGDGLGTYAIYQAALLVLPTIAQLNKVNEVKLILDDANQYGWSRLLELFPPEVEKIPIELGHGLVEYFTYHLFLV